MENILSPSEDSQRTIWEKEQEEGIHKGGWQRDEVPQEDAKMVMQVLQLGAVTQIKRIWPTPAIRLPRGTKQKIFSPPAHLHPLPSPQPRLENWIGPKSLFLSVHWPRASLQAAAP